MHIFYKLKISFYSQELLSNGFVSGLIEDAIGVSGKDIVDTLLSVDEEKEKQMNSFVKLAQLIGNYTACVDSKDRFVPVDSEHELMQEAKKLEKKRLYLAGNN